MGGRPLTALNMIGVPVDLLSPRIMHSILRGGAAKIKEANCDLIGGHTIRNPEPIYGLAVTGMVSPRHMLTNAKARAGDVLILTKPLGTGIITTGIKRGLTSRLLERKVIAIMTKLNSAGAELAERGLLRAAVDVTGFGLLGHLSAMCRASEVGAEIHAARVPAISSEVFDLIAADCIPGGSRDNLAYANHSRNGMESPLQKTLLTDAQTSGGLLLSVPRKNLNRVLKLLKLRHSLRRCHWPNRALRQTKDKGQSMNRSAPQHPIRRQDLTGDRRH